MALRATKANILADVLRRGLSPVLAGMILGIAGALITTRGMAQLTFELKPDDPGTYAEIGFIFLGAATLSCLGAARRAVSVDPVVTLRAE